MIIYYYVHLFPVSDIVFIPALIHCSSEIKYGVLGYFDDQRSCLSRP